MRIYFLTLLSLLLIGCNPFSAPDNTHEALTPPPSEKNKAESLADQLNTPWTIEKSGDTIYLTERPGAIVKLENGEVTRQQLTLEKEVSTNSEAGLLGFILAPDFPESQLAYAYYTYNEDGQAYNRIITLKNEGNLWQEQDILIDHIPSGNVHHGGRIAIGPDNKLYATTGDAAQPELAQDIHSLAGKILRFNLDGSIPEDNPFDNSYVYSYGHRNPQGLAWSEEQTLYASEHGDNANDEINQIEAGNNYGWPIIEGTETHTDMVTPLFTSGSDITWAPSGMAYYQGSLYVATLRGAAILAFHLEEQIQDAFIEDYGRIRDVYIEGDELYFITNNTDGRGSAQTNDDQLYLIRLD